MFRHRSAAAEPPAPSGSARDDGRPTTGAAAGKGRPTISRKDAQQQRQTRVRASLDPKAAARQHRNRMKEQRSRARQALLSGDERHLPPRDKGPVRRFVRDLVDSRRSPGEYFLYTAAAMLGISLIDEPEIKAGSVVVLLALTAAAIVDSIVLARRLRRELAQRFADEDTSGAVGYGVLRSMQVRRLRLPSPQTSPSTEPFWRRWRRAKSDRADTPAGAEPAAQKGKAEKPGRTPTAS